MTEEVIAFAPVREPQEIVNNVCLVLDKSSSMGKCLDSTISGFNELLLSLQDDEDGESTLVTLVTFSGKTQIEVNLVGVPASEVEPLTRDTYVTRGITALYSGVVRGIQAVRASVDEGDLKNAFLMYILSDGDDNDSHPEDQALLPGLVKELEETDRWTVSFIGANVDVLKVASSIGISDMGNVASYVQSNAGTRSAFAAASMSTQGFRSARRRGQTSVKGFYSSVTGKDGGSVGENFVPDVSQAVVMPTPDSQNSKGQQNE